MRIRRNRALRSNNRLTTSQRQLLLDTLLEAGEHLDAKQLYRRAADKDPRISLATVYRNLRLFKELGLVEERRLEGAHCCYELRTPGEHHHLVCTRCGQVAEFRSALVGRLVSDIERERCFRVTRAMLYLEGHCGQCEALNE